MWWSVLLLLRQALVTCILSLLRCFQELIISVLFLNFSIFTSTRIKSSGCQQAERRGDDKGLRYLNVPNGFQEIASPFWSCFVRHVTWSKWDLIAHSLKASSDKRLSFLEIQLLSLLLILFVPSRLTQPQLAFKHLLTPNCVFFFFLSTPPVPLSSAELFHAASNGITPPVSRSLLSGLHRWAAD